MADPLTPRRELRIVDLRGRARLRHRPGESGSIVLVRPSCELVAALVAEKPVEGATRSTLRTGHGRHKA